MRNISVTVKSSRPLAAAGAESSKPSGFQPEGGIFIQILPTRISTASEASTADVKDLADTIANRQIPAIFIESSVPVRNIEAVQAAVQDRGFNVKIGGELFSDAMGEEGTPEGTYIGMVRHNVDTIVDGLTNNQ